VISTVSVGLVNQIATLADQHNVSPVGDATLSFRSLTDGAYHILTGVSPAKISR